MQQGATVCEFARSGRMKVKYSAPWLNDDAMQGKSEILATIASAEVQTTAKGSDVEITVHPHGTKEQYRMSVYGKNLWILINNFGDDTDGWKGKDIKLTVTEENGKRRRHVQLP